PGTCRLGLRCALLRGPRARRARGGRPARRARQAYRALRACGRARALDDDDRPRSGEVAGQSVCRLMNKRVYPWVLVGLLSFNFGVAYFDRQALNFLMPLIQPELPLTNQPVGLLCSAL